MTQKYTQIIRRKKLETLRPWDWVIDVEGDDGEADEALTTKGTGEIFRKEYLKEGDLGKLRNEKDLRWWWEELMPPNNDRDDANAVSIACYWKQKREGKFVQFKNQI